MAHTHEHTHQHNHAHSHSHGHAHDDVLHTWGSSIFSFVMLASGMLLSHFDTHWFTVSWVELTWYIVAFLPVGLPVIKEAVEGLRAHDYFNEFTLMTLACIGAFCIGEWPEAVGVMLFYSIGETLQDRAVDSATRNISKLLDMRGDKAFVVGADGNVTTVKPQDVRVGQTIEVLPGGRVPLDGTLTDADALFDTSALTGESMPRTITAGGEVLAGMISAQSRVRVTVTKPYGESTLARILAMVRDASSRKAHAEVFIHKFAHIYTPVVIALAVLVVAVPALVSAFDADFHYHFAEWLYRALVFLVISCPCALVISVPLGYFAGIGAASRAGILFKGGNYLEAITKVNVVAFDKTGTLTTGRFSVVKTVIAQASNDSDAKSTVDDDTKLLALLAAAEGSSTHPLAKALCSYVAERQIVVPAATEVCERPGYGTEAVVEGVKVLAGNVRMMQTNGIEVPAGLADVADTVIVAAIDNRYAGYVVLSDTLKPDAAEAVADLKVLGINDIVMLSGDRPEIVREFATHLGISEAHGGMLPQDKAEYVEQVSRTPGRNIAFVGDGMNDAPVLAVSNIGLAMGGLGSDAAIESADVVIQTDSPARVATAIHIGRRTHAIVTQNIVGAIAIKILILGLGAAGYASLWAAVFADVGVALLAVLNSMRILWHK